MKKFDLALLDSEMKLAGMTPLSELIKGDLLTEVQDLELKQDVSLKGKLTDLHEMLTTVQLMMSAKGHKDNDIYQWVFHHARVFSEMLSTIDNH